MIWGLARRGGPLILDCRRGPVSTTSRATIHLGAGAFNAENRQTPTLTGVIKARNADMLSCCAVVRGQLSHEKNGWVEGSGSQVGWTGDGGQQDETDGNRDV